MQGVRKELEGAKREVKQQTGAQSAVEVRLNRALEEAQRLRSQLQEARSSNKDSDGKVRRQVEQLQAENRRLEKQKNDLAAGFKKQLKLIDVLKRQRVREGGRVERGMWEEGGGGRRRREEGGERRRRAPRAGPRRARGHRPRSEDPGRTEAAIFISSLFYFLVRF